MPGAFGFLDALRGKRLVQCRQPRSSPAHPCPSFACHKRSSEKINGWGIGLTRHDGQALECTATVGMEQPAVSTAEATIAVPLHRGNSLLAFRSCRARLPGLRPQITL